MSGPERAGPTGRSGPEAEATHPASEVLVWGAGAMGGTIGAVLARAGHRVHFVDRVREHVEAMRSAGLTISGPIASFTVPASADTPDTLRDRWTTVLLCVKAHHTEEAARQVLPHLAPDGIVVSIQNGLNEPVIARIVGKDRTVGSFVNFGADYLEPGHIHWGGRGTVVVGEIDGRLTPRVRRLHGLLMDFEPNAILSDNVFGYLWSKLAYAALLFDTALTDDSIADCLANSAYRDLHAAVAREVVAVAEATGIRLEPFDGFDPSAFRPGGDRAAAVRSLDDLVAFNRRSAKTHSGIWRDLAVRKRRTEVDAQLGPVAEAGRIAGIPTPRIEAIIRMIHEIEEGRRDRSLANLEALLEAGR